MYSTSFRFSKQAYEHKLTRWYNNIASLYYIRTWNSPVLSIALSLFRSPSVIISRKKTRVYKTYGHGGTLLVIDAFTLNCDTLSGEHELNPIITRFLI